MSRIRNRITVTVGAAAGLFLTALASGGTATADTVAPTIPGLPGVVDQVITGIPQQLLQTTTSALTGAPLTPAASSAPTPIASATLNMPQAPAGLTPGAVPAAGSSIMPGFQLPPSISSLLPFPLPNLAGGAAPVAAPSVTIPGAFLPSAPAVVAAPTAAIPGGWLPVSGLP